MVNINTVITGSAYLPLSGGTMTGDITIGNMLLDQSADIFYINDTANAGMTKGITINQGTATNQIFAGKSTNVAHGLTSQAETDTWVEIIQTTGDKGGVAIRSFHENAANYPAMQFVSFGGQADTTHTTAGRSLIEFYASQHNGSNALADIAADGLVFGVRCRRGSADVAVALVDEDGDLWINGFLTDSMLIHSAAAFAFQEATTISGVTAYSLIAGGNIKSAVDNSNVTIFGGSAGGGKGAYVYLTGKDDAGNGKIELVTPDAAETGDVTRLLISGGATTATFEVSNSNVKLNLPTSNPGAGILWSNLGIVTVGT